MYKDILVLYKFLSKKNKLRIIKIFFLSFISTLLELVALSSLFPFILLLLNRNTNFDNRYLNYFFLNFSYEKLFSILLLIIIFIFVIKNIYLYYFQRYKFRSIFYLSKDLKIILFDIYLKKKFIFFTKKDYSEIINNIRSEAPQIALNIVNCCLDIAIDIFLILFIYVFLLFLNPVPVLILTIFLLIFFFFIKSVFQKKLNYLGEQRLNNEIKQTKLINESIYGIRDLILFNLGNNIKKILSKTINLTIIPQYKSLLISSSIKLILEPLSIIFIFLMFFIIGFSNVTNHHLSFIAILGYSFIRLMPNFVNIFKNYQSISFYYPSGKKVLNLIKKNISSIKVEKKFKTKTNNNFLINKIELKNLTFKYPDSDYIIKKLNLKIIRGEKIIIMGDSGSGKSTLLDIFTGLIYPSSGKILVNNQLLVKNLNNYQNKLSYSSQENFIFSGNILNNFKFDDQKNDNKHKEKFIMLKKIFFNLNIKFIKYNSINNISERGSNFSGGEKQKISLARAVFKNSDMIVLDEPTSSLDKKNSYMIIEKVLNYYKDKIVICVSHDEKLIKYFDKAFCLKNKRLYKI
jgi:ABC-type bacteriocin/lantibiotic exporter with double-glycine peptidase domain